MMAYLSISKVEKSYSKEKKIIQGLDLEVEKGEFLVIVGPSGCGKSTLLRMIAGLEEIDKGKIIIDGVVVNGLSPAQRDIAMVFQNYALYPHMNVYKNLSYGLKNRGMGKEVIAQRVEKVAQLLQIEELLQRKPAALSGGQRQRVAMGRAIVREPKVFLFDEPLSNLDAKLRHQMRIEIRKLHERLGITSVYVTHDQVEAMTLADRIVILNEGKIEQVGTPNEIYRSPASVFVARFMGTPPMNILPMQVVGGSVDFLGTAIEIERPDGAIFVGMRPETIQDTVSDLSIEIDVDMVERLGSENIIYGTCQGHAIVIKSEKSLSRGDHTTLYVSRDDLYFFST
jgi:sn-glycerol 3-phosphate transport system ATP-binding protein